MNQEEIASWQPFLKRIPLFTGLSAADLARVATRMQLLSLPKGAVLFSQGDEGDAMYIVASGQIRLFVNQRGAEVVTGLLGRGEALGEVGLLTGERRTVSVRLDTTCEFLKLQRRDFEEVLRENPSILLHLSRMLSKRLVESHRPAARAASGTPQLLVFNGALSAADRQVLFTQLAFDLHEQTRRRVLIVDMEPEPGALARVLGLKPKVISEGMLRGVNLRDTGAIRELVQEHVSGLEIMSLPAAILGGRLYSGIYLFLNFLRDAYDVVLIHLSNHLGDVERSILSEADRAILAGSEEGRPQFRHLQAELGSLLEPRRLVQVWLGELDPELVTFAFGGEKVVLPWSGATAERLSRTGSPFAALEGEPRSRLAVARLARTLSGIKVGLAIGAGAALGHSVIGILKTFKREHIPIDLVAGTSIGAIIAGFLALGMEPEEIEEIAVKIDKGWVYENLFWDMTLPRSGLFAGQTLLRFLRSYFGTKEFSDLDIPFSCVATDIESGEEVVLREGRVAEAIRASCGLPLIFKPLRLQGRYLVDGGLVNPVPTRVIADQGADAIIAISLTMPAGTRKPRRPGAAAPAFQLPVHLESLKDFAIGDALRTPNLLEVFFQMIYTMEYEIAQSRVNPAHVVIHPDLSGFSWTELHRAKELITMGERIAEAYVPQIKALIPYFNNHCQIPLKTGGVA